MAKKKVKKVEAKKFLASPTQFGIQLQGKTVSDMDAEEDEDWNRMIRSGAMKKI